jgi:hypothetical protein
MPLNPNVKPRYIKIYVNYTALIVFRTAGSQQAPLTEVKYQKSENDRYLPTFATSNLSLDLSPSVLRVG